MKVRVKNYTAPEIIKIIREDVGMTQTEFAQAINMSVGGLQKYETGQRKYSFETLMYICKKFNIEIILDNRK